MLDVLCIGAHPDDNEFYAGGTAARMADRGARVRFVSVTDGSKGHYAPEYIANPDLLTVRRLDEARAAAAIAGASYEMLGLPDGEVYVTPANTEMMVRVLREAGEPGRGPDLVLMNRPTDYHRDHRYTAQLVLDASYMLTVPAMCPDTPALRRMPIFAYWHDAFTEGGAFRADIAVCIDDVMERKIDMITQHVSQFYEWIPYNQGSHAEFADFPADPVERRARMASLVRGYAQNVRSVVDGAPGAGGSCAEAFQISEYGRQPDAAELREIFG